MKQLSLVLLATLMALSACDSKDKKVEKPAELTDIKNPTVHIKKLWGASVGGGEVVRAGLIDLLRSQSPDDSQAAYWRIENHAVVQGELYEVAEACTSVLVSSFAEPRAKCIRTLSCSNTLQRKSCELICM